MTDTSELPVILILTVGGSPEPLLRAIEEADPRGLMLIASGGEGGQMASEPKAREMAAAFRQGQPDRFASVTTVPADDPDVGFDRVIAAIETTHRNKPGHRLIANYTGGTKSMSGALLMAAFHRRLEVQITTGARTDLTRVVSGTESARQLDTRLMGVEADLATALRLAEGGDYAGAAFLVETLKRDGARNGLRPSKSLRKRLEVSLQWTKCLAAWDVFDHRTAHDLLEGAWDTGTAWAGILDKSGHRKLLSNIVSSGKDPSVSLCVDLLANAQRRCKQHRYDDALARLYRFTEACAQTQLFRRWGLKTGELSETDLPEFLKGQVRAKIDYLDRKFYQIALNQTVKFLEHLDPADPMARAYIDAGEHGPTWLSDRNRSILAHGYQAIDRKVVDSALAWVNAKAIPAMGLQPPAGFPSLS